ncbi:MAG TPA: chromate efflux transporter [Candidatus Krumholzibacteria bacterium]|nr:chromate efflux transporter [Candidatus Krumholzibacteria bacterium]HPD73271.1 chromate efflux transporter [Candidatus Krumholzibacteria bacterium]HRY40233.1 chromate efflux transporter [Candidatus Krumholzibacteria bacterium]
MSPGRRLPATTSRLGEVARLFLRLGAVAFGGPAAHIAMMHDEVVTRRRWLTEQQFLDLVGATNLIPGPNSTEMAIHVGHQRAGWRGLIVAGVCFIMPAMVIVTAFARLYVRYGSTPQAGWLLWGVKPVVIAIIVQALWLLGRKAARGLLLAGVGLGVFVLQLAGVHELLLLFAAGLVVMVASNVKRPLSPSLGSVVLAPILGVNATAAAAGVATPFSLQLLALTFLKIGAVLFGSGYVLLAFLRADLVVRFGWLTDQQLVDAVAVGQVTPGPLFTTATFIGYVLAGIPGALLATVAIFLPSFIFVAVTNPLIPRMRRSRTIGSLLDGINVASLGLMAAVTAQLGRSSLTDVPSAAMAAIAMVLLVRFRINSTWLIAGGAMAGILRAMLV